MKGTLLQLLERLATMITAFFKNETDTESFVSRYKNSYYPKTTIMRTTSETSGYFIRQNQRPIRNDGSATEPSVVLYSVIHFNTLKKAFMKSLLLRCVLVAFALLLANVFFVQKSVAQGTMGSWQMCGLSGTPASVTATGTLANVTFSTLTRGAGLAGASVTNGFSSTGWSTATSLSIAQNDYYEFTITPAPGYKMSITSLKIRDQVSTTSSSFDAYVRYDEDAYASNLSTWAASTTATNRTVNLSGNAALQNRTTPVTFRIYGSDATSSTTTTYRLDCQGIGAGNFRGVDVDGSVTQLAYASQLVSINTGGATWCAGETRNVTVQIKNIGSTAWTDGGGNDFNIGAKWNSASPNWLDYHVRVDAQNLAPGATGTFVLPITASNNPGTGYTTPLPAGTNNLTFDIVWEGITWFGNNGGGVGPGNTAFVSANQTITALPTITKGANPTVCQGSTSANLTYSATTGSPNQYSIDYDAAANLAGFVDVVNATLPATPIVMVVPAAVAGGTYNGSLTVRNSTSGCSSTAQAIAVTVTARPTITPGISPTVCRGTTSALLSYTATNSPNQYSIDYDATANAAGFVDVTNAALPGGNITLVIPAAAAADLYNANLTVRNSTTGCVSVVSAITVTVNAPSVSFTGATTFCVGSGTTLSPATGGTWVSNSPLVASVDNDGNVTGLTAGTATFTFTETATGCSSTTGSITVQGNSTLTLTSGVGTDAQTKCINNAITNITYLVGGGGTGASVSGLPSGVTGSYNSGTKVFTISGSPTVAGSFSYTVTTTGPCVNPSLGGTIDVTAASGITLTSGAGTNTQTRCINNAFTDITFAMDGTATGISITSGALPAGVTGTFDAGVFTISGTPTVSGTFGYTVSTSGPCPLSLTGTLTVTADAALTRTSAVGTDAQTKCISTAITNITYLVAGSGTGATVSGLPTGVTGAYNSGTKVFTISGTPGVAGTFNYTVNATGPCINPSLSGSIVVTADATISLTSAVGSNVQTVCADAPISDITYLIGGSGTGAVASGLPAGITGSFNTGVFTISGSPTASGVFNYSVTTTGPCVNPDLTGTITVNDLPSSLSITPSSETICTGTSTGLAAAATTAGATAINSDNFTGTPTYTTSGTVSGNGSQTWAKETSGTNVNGITTFTSPNGGGTMIAVSAITSCFSFGGCSSSAATILTSAAINTNNYTSLTISYFHTYKQGASGSGKVEISTDNVNWTTLKTFTTNQGTETGYIGDNITLANTYLNQANLRIRFNFASSTSNGFFGTSSAWWAVDDVAVNGVPMPLFSWTASTGSGVNGLPVGAGIPSAANKNITVNPTATTTYTLKAQNPLTGCSVANATAIVTVNPDATITLTSAVGTDAQFTCNNSAISNIVYTLGGGGAGAGVTGLPPGVSGLYNAGVFTISGTPTVAGSYNYTVTTTGTCVQAVANGTITVGARPTTSFTAVNVSSCSSVVDGSLTVTASGGTGPYTYSWTGMTGVGAHVPYTAGNTATITGLDIGYYDVSIADAQGCNSSITGMHIQYAFSSYITHNGSISSGCANTGSIILYANAGVQPYTFSLDGTNYTSNNSFLNLAAGTYTAYVKDGAGCVITKSIFIAAAPPIVVNPFVRPASSCGADGVIEIYRTGGIPPYQYSMDGVNYQVGNVYSNLPAGTYTTYVKDSKGCIGVQQAVVTQGAALAVSASKVNTSSCVDDGSIQVNPTGGLPPYQYKLGSGSFQSSNSFSGLAAGPYAITVKDSKGCQGNINVTINVNTIGVTYYTAPASSCAASDGTIQLFRTGGTGPYTYSLDGNTYQSSPIFTGLAAGTYDGFVKDSKTCIGASLNIILGPDCPTPVAPVTFSKSGTNSNSVKDNAVKVSANSVLKVNAYPNPSGAAFTLLMEGGSNAKVVISVTDLLGRKVYQAEGDVKKQYNFGNNFKTGMYILQVTQGNDKQSIKLVKE